MTIKQNIYNNEKYKLGKSIGKQNRKNVRINAESMKGIMAFERT